jgi:hypothetical protein
MATYKPDNIADRQAAAAKARRATVEKFQNQPKADDPVVIARVLERKAVADARDRRSADRAAAREEEAVQRQAEQAADVVRAAELAAAAQRLQVEQAAHATEAARLAEAEATEKKARVAGLDQEKRQRALTLAADQKAERDARYAARKKRQR